MDATRLDEILQEHRTGPQIKPGTFVNKPTVQQRPAKSEDDEENTGSNYSGA